MSDSKYFTTTKRGEIQELRSDLISDKKDKKKAAMKVVVANMTMGNDMSSLYPDVLECLQSPMIELRKMAYLYLINYAKTKPDQTLNAVQAIAKDCNDHNPLIRALALRTLGYIPVDKIGETLVEPLRRCLKDLDPYVRKTAATTVLKLWVIDRDLAIKDGFVDSLIDLLTDSNPTVVANAIAALTEINERSPEGIKLNMNATVANKLVTAMNDCSEWGQAYILEALLLFVPTDSQDAETIAERIQPRLQHANSSVVLTSMKVINYLMNFITNEEVISNLSKKMSPPLVTLLNSGPEVQYVALRNALLIIQKRPEILRNDVKVFFCKYFDPIYVKLSKLEMMFRLANESNVDLVLSELKEYASEVDVDFVRKSVRCIGRLAVKIEKTAEKCIEVLLELIQTKVNYVLQEAIVVIKDIFRKYPNRYESIIGVLCENLDSLDEPDAKASMIWIIGQYADRIENSNDLLEQFLEPFKEEPAEVQLALLTATVKLFLKRPSVGQPLVQKVLKWSTEEADNPDLRDRGYIYWRLLSHSPAAAKSVVLSEKPSISTESDRLEPALLEELLLHISSLASIYHKPPHTFIADSKVRRLPPNAKGGNPIATAAAAVANQQSANKANAAAASTASAAAKNEVNLLQVSTFGNYEVENPYSTDDVLGGGNLVKNTTQVVNLLDLDIADLAGPSAPAGAASVYGGIPGAGANYQQQQQQQRPATYYGAGAGAGAAVGGAASLAAELGQLNLGFGAQPNSGVAGIYSLAEQSYVPPKVVFLQAQTSKGLEVKGTFSRRNNNIHLELTFTNKALQPLGDFAIQFNKNTFGLQPAAPLEVRSPLPPNSSSDVLLPLRPGGVAAAMDPFNNLQVAIKDSVGIFYFATLIPFHVLLIEDGLLERGDYLKLWREIPDANEKDFTVTGLSGFDSVDAIRNVLSLNNVFTVAERQVDQLSLLYLSVRTIDNIVLLVELTVDPSFANVKIAVRTYSVHYANPLAQAIETLLRSLAAH